MENFDFGTDGDFSLISPPLESDSYLVKIFVSALPAPTYEYELRITVPELGARLTQALALAALGAVVLFRRHRFGRRLRRLEREFPAPL